MDAHRFDSLARRVGTPTSRRTALGTAVAGGVLGALGLRRSESAVQAAPGQSCVLTFTSTVRTGPDANQVLIPGTPPGVLQGELSFTRSNTGNIEQGELLLSTGASVPVVGQATGHSLHLRVALDPGVTLIAMGVGEQEIAACQGSIDGVVTGPGVGDLGDWQATASPRANPVPATSAPVCARGETLCDVNGGFCADLLTDPFNCGACGNQCAVNNCLNGVCGEASAPFQNCAPPLVPCGGACVDLQNDALNCGACGNQCPVNNCSAGVCGGGSGIQNCAPPFGLCDVGCIDLRSDVHNCGGCSVLCAFGEICTNGICVPGPGECEPGEVVCGSFCANLSTNIVNCGACGISCNADEICLQGVCTSDSTCGELTLCGDTCIDISNDSLNCGWCGIICPPGEFCVDRNCAPLSGDGDA